MTHPASIDPDQLRQQIYDAGRAIGSNDPFLAGELTHSVLHFLGKEFDSQSPDAVQLAESVAKIIRELGHPRLALTVQENWASPPPAASPSAYPSNVTAAHELGLIELTDLESPLQMAGGRLDLARWGDVSEAGLVKAIAKAHRRFSRFVEIDLGDPFYRLPHTASWCQTLSGCLELSGLDAFVHLPRFDPFSTGHGLFGELDDPESPFVAPSTLFPEDANFSELEKDPQAEWLVHLAMLKDQRVRPLFHVRDSDIAGARAMLSLRISGTIVFDRPGKAPWRAIGADCPSNLSTVRINLTALWRELAPVEHVDSFVERLGGLVRLAFAAGRAKQSFLRRHGPADLRDAFVLDRASLLVVPQGVEEVAVELAKLAGRPKEALTCEASMHKSMANAASECSTRGLTCLVRSEAMPLQWDAQGHISLPPAGHHHVGLSVARGMTNVVEHCEAALTALYQKTSIKAVSITFLS
ncbi:MAG: hypothetical protein ACJ8C4_06105 [Gemmataceae bacterium]